jgi:hypothetical protein
LAPTAARFCPACGAPVDAAGAAAQPSTPSASRRPLIAVIGGILLAAIAVSAYVVFKPAPTPAVGAGAPLAQAQAPDAGTATPPSPASAGFDWSGLSPEELQAARLALDAAIATEEQAAAAKAAAGSQTASAP